MHTFQKTLLWRGLISPIAFITAGLSAIYSLILAPFMGPKRAFFYTSRLWVRLQMFLCGIDLEGIGYEDLPLDIQNGTQSAIFMSNHQSLMDPPFVLYFIKANAVFMAKKEVKWMPGIGWGAWAAGFIFVDRKNREKALQSVKEAAETIRKGRSVTLFPEGTRSKDGQLGTFKKGGFALAMDAQVPVVPMALDGGRQILPKGSLLPMPGQFKVAFGTVLHPKDFESREALMAATQKQVEELLEGLRKV